VPDSLPTKVSVPMKLSDGSLLVPIMTVYDSKVTKFVSVSAHPVTVYKELFAHTSFVSHAEMV
jgi:hypothetical protein